MTVRGPRHRALPRARSGPLPPSASTAASKRSSSSVSGARAVVRGGERDEDLAAAVVGDRAGACQAEAGAAGDALELCGAERRVGGEDDDAASRRRGRLVLLGEEAADRYPGNAELARRCRSSPGRAPRACPRARPARRADAALPAEAAHAGAGADGALGDRPTRGGRDRPARVGRLDLNRMRLAQVAVVTLPDDGDSTSSAPGGDGQRPPRRRRSARLPGSRSGTPESRAGPIRGSSASP